MKVVGSHGKPELNALLTILRWSRQFQAKELYEA